MSDFNSNQNSAQSNEKNNVKNNEENNEINNTQSNASKFRPIAWVRAMYKKYIVIIRQSLRFGVVGVANTLIDFGIYTWLCYIINYATAQVISYCSAMIFSIFMNKIWTFKQREPLKPRQVAMFVGVNLVSLLVSLGVLTICKESFQLSNTISKIIAMPFTLTVNFFGNRLIVFKKAAQAGE